MHKKQNDGSELLALSSIEPETLGVTAAELPALRDAYFKDVARLVTKEESEKKCAFDDLRSERYFNPLLLLHGVEDDHPILGPVARSLAEWGRAVDSSKKEKATANETTTVDEGTLKELKGAVVVQLLLAGLRLRAQYGRYGAADAEKLITHLAGCDVWSLGSCSDRCPVRFGFTMNDTVESFPVHSETTDSALDEDESQRQASALLCGETRTAIAAATAKLNKGCNVLQLAIDDEKKGRKSTMGDKRTKLLFVFETRFWDAACTSTAHHHVARSAMMCLAGLLANYRGVFQQVAFVCLMPSGAVKKVNWQMETLDSETACAAELATIAAALQEKGSRVTAPANEDLTLRWLDRAAAVLDPKLSFSVHVVDCPSKYNTIASPELSASMMLALTYLMPEF